MAFAVQAVLLVGLGTLYRHTYAPPSGVAVQGLGWLLAITGVVFYPLAGLLAGHPWTQAEVFGIAPEPTALASLIPTLALLVGAATLWMMADHLTQ